MQYSVISANDNPDYSFYIPIVSYSWNREKFTPIIFHDISPKRLKIIKKYTPNAIFIKINTKIEDIKPVTIIQSMRLYAYQLDSIQDNDYIIMGDADMIICNSFLFRDMDKINVFGFDITGRTEIPICYVGMYKKYWKQVMEETTIETDIKKLTKYNSDNFYEWWGVDQQIITHKLKKFGLDKVHFIDRGTDQAHGLVEGRYDRYNWNIKPKNEIKDCHALKNIVQYDNFVKLLDFMKTQFPKDNFDWMEKYYVEFTR
jgi:hypothetical protein